MNKNVSKAKLQALLYTDELTQLYNLRYLREQIPSFLEKAKKQKNPVAFFVFDLDDFKNINDGFGHLAGDKALVHFTKIINQKKKDESIAIRYAGDEFLLIIPQLDKQEAKQLGEEIQQIAASSPIKIDGKDIVCDCSVGISQFPHDGHDWKILFAKADEALYVAKEQGKGRVVVVPDSGRLLAPSKLNSILEAPYIVGRDDLIQFLEKHLSKQGDPMLFPVILGEEGSGKTRVLKLAGEFSRKKLQFTLTAKGYSFWQNEMYGAVFAALGSLFEHQQALSERIYSRLQESYKQVLSPRLPAWVLKGHLDTKPIMDGDSTVLFEALTQAFFLLRETGDGAVLLDDIDQIDPPSLQFFGSQFSRGEKGNLYFVSSISSPELTDGEEKMLLLAEGIPELTTGGKVRIFRLEPLRTDHVQQLAKKLFGDTVLSDNTAAVLAQNSRGNPLFIVEALSTLLLERKIFVKGDVWDLSAVTPEDIPTSLTGMVKNRLSGLDKEAVMVLKLASILGEKINPRLIAEISKLKLQQVMNALSDAQRSLFIEESPDPDEYVFSHRMGRSVLYSLMDEKERHKLHALAAKTEQKFAAEAPERIVGRLAYHFHNAGQLEQAAEMLTALKRQMEAVYISKGTQRLLQKRIISASIAKESPLEEEDFTKALRIGRGFRSSMQNLRLYPRANENVKRSLSELMENLEPFLAEKTEVLSISVTPEATLFNGQPPPSHLNDSKLTEDLYAAMNNYGLQGILLLRGLTRDEIIQFLEFFKRHPRDVINRWDELLEQQDISHILPDRKIFVAVGEHKVLLGQSEIYAQPMDEGGEETSGLMPQERTTASEEHIHLLKNILTQFRKEKKELMNALLSSDMDKEKIDKIADILSDTKIERLIQSIQTAKDQSSPGREDFEALDEAVERVVDLQFIERVEGDISLAFEELSSDNSTARAKAATWLLKQEPAALAEAGLKAITSDFPYKFRRIAAGIIRQAGDAAVTSFLHKISPTMPTIQLNKVIKIADAFMDKTEELCTVLREIAMKGPFDTLGATIDVLRKIPGKRADFILLDIFNRAMGMAKFELITAYAERKMKEAAPLLYEYIRPRKIWQKEQDLSLQEHVCRTLGILRSPDSVEVLVKAASEFKFATLNKAKPEFIRAAATWALTQMPQSQSVDRALAALKKDHSTLVRKAAELFDIIREETI